MFDNSKELNDEDREILRAIKNKKAIILINKTDLKKSNLEKRKEILNTEKKVIKISLKEELNLNAIYNELKAMFNLGQITSDNEITITNIRHKELIRQALYYLKEAKQSLQEKMPVDIISINISQAMEKIGEITGENVSEDVIKEIFAKFCVGK